MSSRPAVLVLVFVVVASAAVAQDALDLARMMFENGDYAGAARVFEAEVLRGTVSGADTAMYAIALSETDRDEEAAAVAAELVATHGERGFAQYAAGIVAFNATDYADAADRFERATALASGRAEYRFALAISLVNVGATHREDGEIDRAADAYRAALDLRVDDARVLASIAEGLGAAGDPTGRLAALEAWARTDPGSPAAWAQLGAARRAAGAEPAALEAFRRAVLLGADEPGPYLAVARADHDLPTLHLAIGAAIHKAGALELGAARQLERDDGQMDEAVLRSVEAYADQLSATRGQLSQALALLSDWTPSDEFERDVRMLMDWYPHSVELTAVLARYYEEHGDPGRAAVLWRDAVRQAPGFADAHLGLGRCQERAGQLDAATASYRRALAIDGDNRDAYAALADLFRRRGRLGELRQVLIDRNTIDAWNPILLEELIAVERELGLDEIATSRAERLEEMRAESPQ